MASLCLKQSTLIRNVNKCVIKSTVMLSSTNIIGLKRYVSGNSVDPADQAHLSQFALEWWKLDGPVKALHSFNIIRVPFIRDSLIKWFPNTPNSTCLEDKKILEIGCGAGILTEDLAKLGAQVTGIDPCKELLDIAVEHAALNTRLLNKPTYIHTTIEEHSKKHSNEYDGVIASEVIEHIDHTQRDFFIESCVKALKPGGKIIFTTPNRTRLSQFFGIFVAEGLNILPKGTHQYHKFTTPEELKYLLELNDCRVDCTRGYLYYYWANKWSWTTWQEIMFAIRAVKLDKFK